MCKWEPSKKKVNAQFEKGMAETFSPLRTYSFTEYWGGSTIGY